MRLGYFTQYMSFRGSSRAAFDYAYYGRKLYGIEPYIITERQRSDHLAADDFLREFPVLHMEKWASTAEEWQSIFIDTIKDYSLDVVYFIKMGEYDGIISTITPSLIHVWDKYYQPHGTVYAYISKWLSDEMSDGKQPYVPVIVDILKWDHAENLRAQLGIPESALVLGGYIGDNGSFDIKFAHKAIRDIVDIRSDIYFVFMGLEPVIDHPRVIFLPVVYGMANKEKISVINTCDAFVHLRSLGEGFGLSVGEFGVKGKLIITYNNPDCKAHLEILGEKCIIYNDYESLMMIFKDITKSWIQSQDWYTYMQFTPELVMPQFKSVFNL